MSLNAAAYRNPMYILALSPEIPTPDILLVKVHRFMLWYIWHSISHVIEDQYIRLKLIFFGIVY